MEGSTSSELMPDNSGLGTGLGTSNASSVMGEKQQTWAGSSEEQSSRPPVSNAFRLLQAAIVDDEDDDDGVGSSSTDMHTPRLQRPASPPPVRRGASSGTVLPMTSSPPAVPASAAASTAPPPLPVRPPSEPAPSRRPPGPIESDYASRADMLKKRQEKEKELEQRAKAVQDVSETAVKVLSLKKGQGAALLGAEAPKHSRIYDALNPKPLWFQTAQEKRVAEEEKEDLGRIERDQDARIKAAAIAMLESAGVPVQDEEEEEEAEEEEEEVDPTKLADFGDMTAILMERRAQREKEEAAHREELRRQAQVAKQKVQEAMNAELAIIRAREEKERTTREAEKERHLAESVKRAEHELVFTQFKWS